MMTLISEVATSVITNVTTAVIATTAPVERSSSSSSFSRPTYVNITAARIYIRMLHIYTTLATYFTNVTESAKNRSYRS